ncbi:MAG TPA: hypothetical protein VMB50_19580 [Myxococcales bacterium]|nr:hypothetical protein [Myxococcales bacterium]
MDVLTALPKGYPERPVAAGMGEDGSLCLLAQSNGRCYELSPNSEGVTFNNIYFEAYNGTTEQMVYPAPQWWVPTQAGYEADDNGNPNIVSCNWWADATSSPQSVQLWGW